MISLCSYFLKILNNTFYFIKSQHDFIDHSFEAPPISIREKRKIGQNKGSIEERSNKIGILNVYKIFRRGIKS